MQTGQSVTIHLHISVWALVLNEHFHFCHFKGSKNKSFPAKVAVASASYSKMLQLGIFHCDS